MQSYRSSFGYLSSLVLIGAATALAGCGGDGGAAGAQAAPDDAGEAGGTNAGKGGGAGSGTGGSATAGSGGNDSGGTSNDSGGTSSDSGGTSSDSGGTSSDSGGTSSDSGGTSNDSGGTSGDSGGSSNAGTGGTPGGSGGSSDGDEDLNGDYSIDTFNRAEPTGPAHPLVRVENKIMRRDEVSLLGPGAGFGAVLDDAGEDYAKLAGETGLGFVSDLRIVDTTSASLDDDGNDELVVVGFAGTKLVVRVIDSSEDGVFARVREFALEDAAYQHAWVRVDDFDQDGRDEILIAAVHGTGSVVRIYDDALAGFALVKEVHAGAGDLDVAIATGNFDADRAPELALLTLNGKNVVLNVLDDAEHEHASLERLENAETGLFRDAELETSGLRLEAGNFDADAADELVAFADGYNPGGSHGASEGSIFTSMRDDAEHGFSALDILSHDYPRSQESSGYRYKDVWPWQTLVADSEGDGMDELFLLALRSGDEGLGWSLTHEVFPGNAKWSEATTVQTVAEVSYGSPATLTRAAGRSDSRGTDVLIAVHDDLDYQTYRATAQVAGASYQLSLEALGSSVSLSPAGKPVWATGGDWDGDTLRVRYTGEKWLELTRPRPIVLISAPPTKAGAAQNFDGSSTSYGTATSKSTSRTEEIGYTDAITLSFEVSVPVLDFISGSASAEMAEELAQTDTKTATTTYGTSFSSSYDEDVIVFYGSLCERYEYEVLGGNPDLVGTKMTIDVPVASGVYKWTVSYYNDSLGSVGTPIPTDVVHHTLGDPRSYRPGDALPSDVLWSSPTATSVGQGRGGVNRVFIDVSSEETEETTTTTTYTAGGEGGAFVHAGYSHSWNSSSAYAVTVGQSTLFEGVVGDIADPDYRDYFYSFGLYVTTAKLPTGEAFQVIDYYTEGLGDGYAPRL
jgi:hypothetical protein